MTHPPSKTWEGIRNNDGDVVPSMERLRADRGLYKDEKQLLREERGSSNTGRTTYKWCAKHGVKKLSHKCFQEDPPKKADFDFPMVDVFAPYWDPNISKSALPVFVRSKSHKKNLLKANNLVEIG